MLACFHLCKLLYSASMLALCMTMVQVQDIETKAHKETKVLIWTVFAGSKGAANRIKIINLLTKKPHNINQLSEELHLDYKTIQHHVRVLETNNFVSKTGSAYPTIYFIAPLLEFSMDIFEEIHLKILQN